jgi:iron complex outermembrane receptor protein
VSEPVQAATLAINNLFGLTTLLFLMRLKKNSARFPSLYGCSGVALAAVGMLAPAAQAQTQSPSLQTVVVSANRAEQRSFDAPAAIDAVNRDTIEGAGPQVNLSESLNRIPGLTILNRQNYAQDLQLSIRGFGSRAAFGLRGIRLLIDGIPATTPDGQSQGSSVSLTSTDRIEVLRGPLAQLYGNSSGGVIQAFTRDAPESPEFLSQFYTGSFGLRRTDWQYAGRHGNLGLVADYSTFDIDGYRSNSAAQRNQFNGKLSFNPNEQTRVNLVFNRFDMPLAEDPLGLTAAQLAGNPRQAGNNAIATRVRKITGQNQLGTSVNYALDNSSSVTARAYYGTRENLQYQANNFWVGLQRDYYGVGLQYNQQTQIAGRPAALVAGYEYDYSKERRQGGAASVGEKVPGSLNRNEDNIAQNSDFFAQASSLVSDRFTLTAGLRASTVRFNSEDAFLSDGNGSGSVRYSAVNPVLGLTFHASDSLNLYANYGKGFETPTLAEVAYTSTGAATSALFNPSLKASESQHYELGAKWLPTAASRLDVTLFQIRAADEIVVASSSSGRTAFKNAPETKRSGIEISGKAALHPQWQATLAASAINARFSQAYANNNVKVASGNKLPGIPKSFVFSELLWASIPFDSLSKRPQRVTKAGFELTSAGKMFANDSNTASADGYTTLNAKVSQGWDIGPAVLTLYGRVDNLTDKRYVGSVIVNQAVGQFYEPAPGRTWSLGLRVVLPL